MSCISSRTAGGVPVTRQVHQAGNEVGELIGAQEQQRAPARAKVDDGHRHVQQLARAEREELRARNGLDDVEQQLRRMARVALRHRDRFADPPRDQRNIHHIGVHRRHREQPDEAMLDRLMSGVFADDDDVGVRAVAQEAGDRGLREHQQVVAVGELRAGPRRGTAARRAGSTSRPTPAHPAPGSADSRAGRNARRRAIAAAPRRPCGRRRGSVPPGRCRARWPGRAVSPSAPASRAQPGGRPRARPATGRLASSTAFGSAELDSWMWIHASSTASRELSASAEGWMSSSSPVGPRRTRRIGFMIAL